MSTRKPKKKRLSLMERQQQLLEKSGFSKPKPKPRSGGGRGGRRRSYGRSQIHSDGMTARVKQPTETSGSRTQSFMTRNSTSGTLRTAGSCWSHRATAS